MRLVRGLRMLKARPCFLLPAPREFTMDPALLRERNRARHRRSGPILLPGGGARGAARRLGPRERRCPVPAPSSAAAGAGGRARQGSGGQGDRPSAGWGQLPPPCGGGSDSAGGVTYREKQLLEPAQRGCGQQIGRAHV